MLVRMMLSIAVALVVGGAPTAAAAQGSTTHPAGAQIDAVLPSGEPEQVVDHSIGEAAYADLFAPRVLQPSLARAAEAQSPPEPKHTGLKALVTKTASDFAWFPRRRSTWVILGVGGGAAAIAYPYDDEVNEALQDSDGLRKFFKPGKYLGYGWVQAGAAIGLYLVGRYAMEPDQGTHTNKVAHLGFDLLRANLVTQGLTYGIKLAVRRDRPTGECCAFPSGHASVTFATAAVLERHFGYRASWPMFAIAGYVSASRLVDNRHFLSDVLFGSALGMAAGWTVVGRHGRDDFALLPVPTRGGVALAGMWVPSGPASARRAPVETRQAPPQTLATSYVMSDRPGAKRTHRTKQPAN